jgi:GAF domain-containing protein
MIFNLDDRKFRLAAALSANPEHLDLLLQEPPRLDRGSVAGRAALECATIHIPDVTLDTEYAMWGAQRLGSYRTMLGIPLLRNGVPIGSIVLHRSVVRPYTEKEIDLVETFANQAVIAIDNSRLFEEVQARTRELTESLAHQTATGEILASISGSLTDTKPVFDAIVHNLRRLVGSRFAVVQILEGTMVHMPAVDGEPGFDGLINRFPRPLDDTTVGGQAMLYKRTVQVSKLRDNPSAPPAAQSLGREFGYDSTIFSPMVLGGRVIGAIGAAHHKPREFTDKQVALLEAFADQAVIAIENTRLFEAEQASKRELQESLEYQTATSDILNVISRSPIDIQPVFEAIAQSALRLFGVSHVAIMLRRRLGPLQGNCRNRRSSRRFPHSAGARERFWELDSGPLCDQHW